MRLPILACALGALLAALSACNPRPPVVGGCEFTYECEAGSVCRDGRCEVVALPDPGSDGGTTRPTDAGPTPPRDGGMVTLDGGSSDGGMSSDAGTRLTFAPGSYRRCSDDLECAIFGGNCVVELSLSRPTDGGVDRVAISAIDPSFAAGQGICTLPCTSDPRTCDSITVTSPTGASAPFSCQVVYAAQSPYPETAPAFPFDTQLDATAMARGVPFASVCRPPFQHALTHSEQFCAPCTEDLQCGSTGACFYERSAATPRSGTCVEACSASNPCQFGFTCGTLPGSSSAATYCLPSAGTCGRCRDADGDLRGVGRCGAITEPNTAVDCDDANPRAYFDAANPNHAFPAACGNTDVNCNGKSDEAEQLGGSDHCAACGDVCVGRAGDIANARRACLPRTTSNTFACVADCDPGYADCDGDISNGCEAQLGSNAIWAEDADGDGRGSLSNYRYVCSGTQPTGWVQNRTDCNDTAPSIYGGNATLAAAPELCDGLDNNCNGIADDPGFIQDEGTACATGVPGVCGPGTRKCNTVAATADAGASGSFSCIGNVNPTTQAGVAESCDGLDNNCNGQTDEGLDYYAAQGQQNPNGPGAPAVCPVDGGRGICAQGAYACTTSNSSLPDGGTRVVGAWTCQGTPAQATDLIDDNGIDTNCDGSDGDLSAAVFVRPVAGNGSADGKDTNNGTSQAPVATLNRALQLACQNGPPCRDIYLEATTFSSNAAVQVPTFSTTTTTTAPPVRIYGGFSATVVCGPVTCDIVWARTQQGTIIERRAPAPLPAGYAAMEAASGTGPLSVLLDQVRLETRSPDPSTVLMNGAHAPSQMGFVCPQRGCARLTFRNVAIQVDAALHGALGTAAPATAFGDLAGRPGCGTDTNCSGVTQVSDWMSYPGDENTIESTWSNDNLPGRAVAGCPDGARNNGGSSAAIRFSQSGGGNRAYYFQGQRGQGNGGFGGYCYGDRENNNPKYPYYEAAPTRGSNGAGGSGGWRSGSNSLTMSWALNSVRHGVTTGAATFGRSGSGGGGGGGCINHNNFFWCPAGEYRGGGGGAGGCGGFAGGNGGDGGHVVGLILSSVSGTDVTLTTSGTFRVIAGNAGNGGNGAAGGRSSAGGFGGLAPNKHGYLNGGHGGDGGGGGGGAGGQGGTTIGVMRACRRSGGTETSCGFSVPPALLAAPASFIQIGNAGTGGNAGAGGEGGTKIADSDRSDSTPASNGNGGAAGLAGQAMSLQFHNAP